MDFERIKKIRLLLVDDEEHFRNALAKRLKKRGVNELYQAEGGEECLSILTDHPMDVVVMDVKMPGMSGIDILQRIRKMQLDTEVILLTGHAATPDGVEGIKSGAYDYLTKPIEFDHLLGKILQAYEKIQGQIQKREAAEYKARIEKQMIVTERLASLGTLSVGVAHEINNPLAIINEAAGYALSLLTKEELSDIPHNEALKETLKLIESSVKRARAITHQLLGNVQQEESTVNEVDPTELVKETIQLVNSKAKAKEISFKLKTSEGQKIIWTDANLLRQVLINLLNNAIDATPGDNRITIVVETAGGGIAISVSDPGVGIPKEHLTKIFEPFFSTKSPGEGTGLGLFVTKDIIEKIGGTIEVESKVGYGTLFKLQIPNQKIHDGGIISNDNQSKE